MADSATISARLARSREQRLTQIQQQDCWDLVIIGGGIIGAGIFKLASQLKLKVLLLEQQDFAWGASSRSSKMVHGGLRYLAQGDAKLTMTSVKERQKLLTQTHGLVSEQSFVMSHYKKSFPGPRLFNQVLNVYDLFAGKIQHKQWQKTDFLSLVPFAAEQDLLGGSQFCDAMTDDARLVMRLIQESIYLGGEALNYAKVTKLISQDNKVTGVEFCCETEPSQCFSVHSKMVVNATGAWANLLASVADKSRLQMRPLRGSHLVFPSWRLPVASAVSVLHPKDKRPVQIYPWQNVTVVGTTDVEHRQDINNEAVISRQELDYLLACVKYQFPDADISEQDIVSTFAGVRPVVASGGLMAPSQEKRTHTLIHQPGLITVTGGKLTTFRMIAEQVIKAVSATLGFDFSEAKQPIFEPAKCLAEQLTGNSVNHQAIAKQGISPQLQQHIDACYGVFNTEFAKQMCRSLAKPISYSQFIWADLVWAAKYEQVVNLDDLLLRRTRLGNVLPQGALELIKTIKTVCQPYLSWDEQTWQQQVKRYQGLWQRHYSVPNANILSQTKSVEVQL